MGAATSATPRRCRSQWRVDCAGSILSCRICGEFERASTTARPSMAMARPRCAPRGRDGQPEREQEPAGQHHALRLASTKSPEAPANQAGKRCASLRRPLRHERTRKKPDQRQPCQAHHVVRDRGEAHHVPATGEAQRPQRARDRSHPQGTQQIEGADSGQYGVAHHEHPDAPRRWQEQEHVQWIENAVGRVGEQRHSQIQLG